MIAYLWYTGASPSVSLLSIAGAPAGCESGTVHIPGTPSSLLRLRQPELRVAVAASINLLNGGRNRGKKKSLTDRWRSSLTNLLMSANAISGFIDLPAGRK